MTSRAIVSRRAAAVVALSLIAAACGSGQGADDPASADAEPDAPADSAADAEPSGIGAELVVGATALPPGLGNPYASTLSGSAVKNVLPAVFDRLTQVTPEGVEPSLAESWTQNDDLVTWDFQLREGVEFSNGEVLDSTAVVKTFEYLLEGDGQSSQVASFLSGITGVEAVDDTTVRFTTQPANPALPRDVTQAFIVPPDYFFEVGADAFAQDPVGTGPYQAVSWTPDEVVLEPFDGSWRQPTLQGITFQALPDATSRLQALESGQVNIALSLPASLAAGLEKEGTSYDAVSQGTVLAIQFVNTKDETPLNDVRVRKALNLAVNRNEIIDSILLGHSKPANQGSVEGALGYVEEMPDYPHDPERARELLAEAGVEDGFEFLVQLSGEAGDTPDIMQAVAGYLERIGVTMQVEAIPFSQWLENLLTNSFDGDAFSIGYTSQPDYNSLRAYKTVSCFREPAFWCEDDGVQTGLIENADAAESVEEFEAAMTELGEWTHQNPPSLFILESVEFVGVTGPTVEVGFNPMGGLDVDQVRAEG